MGAEPCRSNKDNCHKGKQRDAKAATPVEGAELGSQYQQTDEDELNAFCYAQGVSTWPMLGVKSSDRIFAPYQASLSRRRCLAMTILIMKVSGTRE